MPKKPDPTALTHADACRVRDLIREIKSRTGVTSEDIAERLDWDVRRVTNALSGSQVLLAKNAVALLKAVNPGRAYPVAQESLNRFLTQQRIANGWLARYEASQLAPAVFVPKTEIPRLAAFLAAAVAKTPSTRTRLEHSLEKTLQKAAPRMARGWMAAQLGVALLLEFERLCQERGLASADDKDRLAASPEWTAKPHPTDTPWPAKTPPGNIQRKPFTESYTDFISRLMSSLVNFAFPNTKEDKTKV